MQENKLNTLLFLMLLFLISGCSKQKEVHYTALDAWLSDEANGFSKQSSTGQIQFDCTYLPPEYHALQALVKSESPVSENTYKNILPDYTNSLGFRLKIRTGKGNQNIFNYETPFSSVNERQSYLMNELKHDLILVSGNDTLNCSEAIAENNYGISPWTSITLLFFDTNNRFCNKDFCLTYHDQLFGTSYTHFCYSAKQTTLLPTIEF